ncbi:MAG: NIPSNAP family protein [Chloroflexi bacterium]|nr:NIPSNAP family protein [Chloroflexota bacterium]
MKVFARNGAHLVGFWTTLIGQSNEVIYLLSYPDLAAREAAWAGINSDEEMAAYRAEGIRVHHIEIKVLRPSSFSPLK